MTTPVPIRTIVRFVLLRLPAAALCAASIAAGSPAFGQGVAGGAVAPAGLCLDSAATTTPARLDSLHLAYVEQETVVVGSDDRILVAGNPVFVWRRAVSGWDLLARDSLFGIVIDSGRTTVHAIPTPLPGRTLDGIRAVALPGGWWLVVFADVVPTSTGIHPPVVSMWAGETDGAHWRRVERLPAVRDSLDVTSVSRLDLREGRALFAVKTKRDRHRRVVVFARDGGRWAATDHAFGTADYVTVGSTRSHDLLAVVRLDTTERSDANSLFLYAKAPAETAWRQVTRVSRGLGAPVHDPQLVPDDEEPLLVWRTEDAAGRTEGWMIPASGRGPTRSPMHFGSGIRVVESSARGRSAVIATTDLLKPSTAQLFEVHRPERIARVSSRVTSFAGLTSVALTRDRAVVIQSQPGSSSRDPAVISLLETHAWRCP
jgi:hypothetical protein